MVQTLVKASDSSLAASINNDVMRELDGLCHAMSTDSKPIRCLAAVYAGVCRVCDFINSFISDADSVVKVHKFKALTTIK